MQIHVIISLNLWLARACNRNKQYLEFRAHLHRFRFHDLSLQELRGNRGLKANKGISNRPYPKLKARCGISFWAQWINHARVGRKWTPHYSLPRFRSLACCEDYEQKNYSPQSLSILPASRFLTRSISNARNLPAAFLRSYFFLVSESTSKQGRW